MTSVVYTVGNTYQLIPSHRAKLDRSGQHRKTHDWTLFVDILEGDPDVIQRVTFDLGSTFQPRSFACSCPISVKRPDGTKVWRFSTRQQSYGGTVAKISLLGAGGTREDGPHHSIVLGAQSYGTRQHSFTERAAVRPLPMLKINPNQNFGIELELTSTDATTSVEQIASKLTHKLKGRFGRIVCIQNYADAHNTTSVWKMVPDSSIVCSRNAPYCTKFELVSPILVGGGGLNQASRVLDACNHINNASLQVNKSMGFHVHVDVSGLSLAQLIKIAQNCIKYEDVIDALVPPSRRTGSMECDQFFKSNRQALDDNGYTTNKQRHDALGSCSSVAELADLMNPGSSRYHKINLQNLVTGRQPTIEFRQHSATSNSRKVSSWVRFCVTLVSNSARLAAPSPFKEDRDVDFQFEALFQFVVKDRALRDYYRGRRDDLELEEESACCRGCASGSGMCHAHSQRRANKVYG
ncbi:Putative amidoligase enzyme [Seminavis robusta]|uniref:Amidoligase enzyme n=1 Tax=Seminavis robusta TaxID=568900 RepID=A0A9N8ET02_9STRA|nr:Putative amidoligase enzyme [Seminavis robusta]|eukprot:Sro1504_g278120.1 Putative amidoligase enzyme (465) ;mRNA; f:14537-15931